MHRAWRLHLTTATAAAACISSLARAEPVALRFAAPAGCPGQPEFVAAVGERGGRFDSPEAAARARGIDVNVVAARVGFKGALRVENPSGASDVREVQDADCAEVVRGLAVVAAFALGGEPGRAAAAGETAMPATPAAPAQEQAPVSVVRAKAAVPVANGRPRLRGATFPDLDRLTVPAGTLRFDVDRAFTLLAGAETGMFPGIVLPRWEFAGTLANFVTTPTGESRLILPILQLRGSLTAPGTRRFDDYETRVVAFRFGVDICSLATFDSQGFGLSLCTEVGGGFASLRTRSLEAQPQYKQKKEGGFAYAGLALDARYNIGSLLHVTLRVAGTGQFGSVSAERADGTQLFKTNWLGGYAVAGAGMHFW